MATRDYYEVLGVGKGATEAQIRAIARSRGYGGLVHSAALRLCHGLTTLDEVVRSAFVKDEEDDGSAEGHPHNDGVLDEPCQPTV